MEALKLTKINDNKDFVNVNPKTFYYAISTVLPPTPAAKTNIEKFVRQLGVFPDLKNNQQSIGLNNLLGQLKTKLLVQFFSLVENPTTLQSLNFIINESLLTLSNGETQTVLLRELFKQCRELFSKERAEHVKNVQLSVDEKIAEYSKSLKYINSKRQYELVEIKKNKLTNSLIKEFDGKNPFGNADPDRVLAGVIMGIDILDMREEFFKSAVLSENPSVPMMDLPAEPPHEFSDEDFESLGDYMDKNNRKSLGKLVTPIHDSIKEFGGTPTDQQIQNLITVTLSQIAELIVKAVQLDIVNITGVGKKPAKKTAKKKAIKKVAKKIQSKKKDPVRVTKLGKLSKKDLNKDMERLKSEWDKQAKNLERNRRKDIKFANEQPATNKSVKKKKTTRKKK